jgi:hypothetical protein
MSKMLKMDLHTHPIEALKGEMGIKGIGDINFKVAEAIVKRIKQVGLNGIAITEQGNFNSGWVTSLEIMENFRHENLIILPGAEIHYCGQQFVQIYIPEHFRRRMPFFKGKEWFLILAHPGNNNLENIEKIDQVDYDAVEEKSILGEFPTFKQIASHKNIPAIASSDAHKMEDIGLFHTELEYT